MHRWCRGDVKTPDKAAYVVDVVCRQTVWSRWFDLHLQIKFPIFDVCRNNTDHGTATS